MNNLILTNLGLTNKNYITIEDGLKKFVRIPYSHNLNLFNYELEAMVMEKIRDLNINLPYESLDIKTGIKVSPYIDGLTTLSQQPNMEIALRKVALTLKKLHQTPQINTTFDVRKKYFSYKAKNTVNLFDLTKYESLLDDLSQYPACCLCHNDCVDGNLVFKGEECFLIDYEYACDNHPYFDLMSVITENNIEDENLVLSFLTTYFGRKPTQDELTGCQFFKKIHALLWCQWAMMQASQIEDNDIYKLIAAEKYQQLNKQ